MNKKKKIKQEKTYTYNVWLQVEQIDEKNDDNGLDLSCIKLGKFIDEEKAIKYSDTIVKICNALATYIAKKSDNEQRLNDLKELSKCHAKWQSSDNEKDHDAFVRMCQKILRY